MPRYFFDVEDGGYTADEKGMEIDSANFVRETALRTLFDLAKHEAVASDEREMMVTVRDEAGRQIYHATVSLRGGWLNGDSNG